MRQTCSHVCFCCAAHALKWHGSAANRVVDTELDSAGPRAGATRRVRGTATRAWAPFGTQAPPPSHPPPLPQQVQAVSISNSSSRRTLVAALLAAPLAAQLVATGGAAHADSELQTYKDEEDKFSITVPAGWARAVPQEKYDRFRCARSDLRTPLCTSRCRVHTQKARVKP